VKHTCTQVRYQSEHPVYQWCQWYGTTGVWHTVSHCTAVHCLVTRCICKVHTFIFLMVPPLPTAFQSTSSMQMRFHWGLLATR